MGPSCHSGLLPIPFLGSEPVIIIDNKISKYTVPVQVWIDVIMISDVMRSIIAIAIVIIPTSPKISASPA